MAAPVRLAPSTEKPPGRTAPPMAEPIAERASVAIEVAPGSSVVAGGESDRKSRGSALVGKAEGGSDPAPPPGVEVDLCGRRALHRVDHASLAREDGRMLGHGTGPHAEDHHIAGAGRS